MQTGPHLLLIQSWFRIASIRRASSSARRVSQRTGSAPAISSSQRGHPAVLRPKTGPPHVCLVVIFIHPYCFGVSILSHRYRKESVALPYLFVYQSSSTCGLAVYLFIFRSASKRLRPCDLMFFIWALAISKRDEERISMQEVFMFGLGRQLLELCGPIVFIGLFLALALLVWRVRKENVWVARIDDWKLGSSGDPIPTLRRTSSWLFLIIRSIACVTMDRKESLTLILAWHF